MDETTFQRELCELKQRASEMASSPSPAPSVAQLSGFMLSNALQNDLFVAQIRDVRTRLDIMQASLVKSQVEKETVEARSPQYVTTDLSRSEAFQVLNLTVHGLQDLTVRCHRDTSDRLGRLEQAISGLQGTLAFTPAASETTIEDLHASQESHYFESTDEPEPKSDAAVHDFFDQQDQERPATVPQVLEETLTDGVTIPQPFMAICPPKLDEHPQLLPDAVDTSSTTATFDNPHNANLLSDCGDNLEATREDVAEPQNAVPDDIAQIAKGLTTELDIFEETRKQQVEQFEARLSAKDAVIAHLKTCRQAADEASQITRTDLESRLAECEDQFVRWKQEADAAHGGFEAMARCNRELRAAHDLALGRMKQDLKHCEASRHHFMTKYVDENYRYKWLEQKKLQSEQNLCQRLDECERALQSSERNRDSDIRDAMQSRDEELDQLYAFCQEKYDIVSHQERIIAQGTSILQDRDAEIDSLHTALAESKRERRHVQERASNFKRTLRNRDDEIEDLKCVIREEKDRRRRAEALVRKEAESKTNKSKDVRFRVDEERPSRPFAPAIDAVGNGHEVGEQPMWTPQPIRSSRLPQEEVRASLWQDDVRSAPDHQFGTASPIARRRKPDAKDDVIGERAARDNEKIPVQHFGPSIADLRDTTHGQRGSQVPHREHRWHNGAQRGWNPPEAQSDASSGRVIGGRSSRSGMEAQATANSGTAENRRHALPLDLTWLPPLPARASASASASMGKMSSVPNLRAGGHQQDGRNAGAISKPASMLELRPQKYHAPSVETEAESAEDRGGSSLLDR